VSVQLSKLTPVQAGGNLLNTLTADRINAIQDAIKYLLSGGNLHAGTGIEIVKGGTGYSINQKEVSPDGKYRQIQEWNYTEGDMSLQCRYNGKLNYQPYRDLGGVEIPYPRKNNEHDNCYPPNPPLNTWSKLDHTYQSGQNFLENKGGYFIFNEPGVYELEFDMTAMHKADSCEPHMNTHSFDVLTFPVLGNKGRTPTWTGNEWDWNGGRTDYAGENLDVKFPQNGFVMFSVHGKQRMPNDTNVHFEMFDEEKKLGIRGKAGIKYPAGQCYYTPAEVDECAVVRDEGQTASHECSGSNVVIPSFSLVQSSSSISCPSFSLKLSDCSFKVWKPTVNYQKVEIPPIKAKIKGLLKIPQIIPSYTAIPYNFKFQTLYQYDCDTYNFALCSSSTTHKIYKKFKHKAKIKGEFNIPILKLETRPCGGGTFWAWNKKWKNFPKDIHYNEIKELPPEKVKVTGDVTFKVPVRIDETPKTCYNTIYDYELSSHHIVHSHAQIVSEGTKICGGYTGTTAVEITVPTGLIPGTTEIEYDYPKFSLTPFTCGGATIDVDITNTTINVPSTIVPTLRDTFVEYEPSTYKPDLKVLTVGEDIEIPTIVSDVFKCGGSSISKMEFEAELDVPVDIKKTSTKTTAEIELPDYEEKTTSVITDCGTPEFGAAITAVTPVITTVSDTVGGKITLDVPVSLNPGEKDATVSIPVPQLQNTTLPLPVVMSTTNLSVVTNVDTWKTSVVEDITVTTNTVTGSVSGNIDINVVTGLAKSTEIVTATVDVPEFTNTTLQYVSSVGKSNQTLNIPTISFSTGQTSATGCCYVHSHDD
jgi:hypothetical protein